ncbi:MAG: rhombosortase [Gammaproteobacteria bacterium]|nr:rhombosortase [Gammaproteobacteria bacterium]
MSSFLHKYWLSVSITLVVLILLLLEPTASNWLEYNRTAVTNGQYWRFITANLVHLSPQHTLMNLASLWLITLIFRSLININDWIYWFLALYFCNILGMHLWLPELNQYVGMSGALYGLIAACCVAEMRLKVWLSGLLLIVVGIKIFAPQILGISSEYDSWIGGFVVDESHIIGYLQGVILGLVWPKSRLNQPAFSQLISKK